MTSHIGKDSISSTDDEPDGTVVTSRAFFVTREDEMLRVRGTTRGRATWTWFVEGKDRCVKAQVERRAKQHPVGICWLDQIVWASDVTISE